MARSIIDQRQSVVDPQGTEHTRRWVIPVCVVVIPI
jgi:hypothetical protein